MTQELGAGKYVKKPYSMEELAIAVHNELMRERPANERAAS